MFGNEVARSSGGRWASRGPRLATRRHAHGSGRYVQRIRTYHVQRIRTSCVSRQSDLNAIKRNPQRGTSRGAPAPHTSRSSRAHEACKGKSRNRRTLRRYVTTVYPPGWVPRARRPPRVLRVYYYFGSTYESRHPLMALARFCTWPISAIWAVRPRAVRKAPYLGNVGSNLTPAKWRAREPMPAVMGAVMGAAPRSCAPCLRGRAP